MNALLFTNAFNFPIHNNTTYSGAQLILSETDKYTVGREFAWLSFTSSSSNESEARRFAKNSCMFIIDNSQICIWSPKGIGKISEHPAEYEYLYPCGAQFKVMDVKEENGLRKIYLKLICRTEPRQFMHIVCINLEKKAKEVRELMANSIERRKKN